MNALILSLSITVCVLLIQIVFSRPLELHDVDDDDGRKRDDRLNDDGKSMYSDDDNDKGSVDVLGRPKYSEKLVRIVTSIL